MASTLKWSATPTQRANLLTTELNSLAAAARTNAGAQLDNSTNLDKYAFLELICTFPTAPAAGGYISVYIITALDGTTYQDGSSSVDPGFNTFATNVPVRAVTTAQNVQVGPIALPPSKFKLIAVNNASTALASTGNIVNLYTDNDEAK